MEMRVENEVTVLGIMNDDCTSLLRTVEPLLAEGQRAFVFDMTNALFLNSVNIAAIIATRNKILEVGGRAAVANMSINIQSVFRILKLERMFNLDMDLAQAIAHVKAR